MQQNAVGTFSLDDNDWSGIVITKSAATQIIKLMQQNPQAKGLKLSVKPSGCAGFTYVLDIAESPASDDLLFEHQKAKLYVPSKSMPFVDGTKVDYVREGLNQIFKFDNPKAQHSCGCGESFGV
ncbi:Fe-S cluster assembly scaffold SufA [Candidatus Fukatsuia symbiotica]|uniref:Fe-S cluster assembly scaffold SufA n=1 Tax=Candidatus Fukatsuia symbiotica TaxID=1878942 RepID=A0A2U8I5F3_9GAMM|nr:Fe-S cluster assembly scaffold SufA [Candidatus Fukatsuia symbiotica]AWK14358.1 Fe-S cluster assembly scaffold SufA [Candidatus Fukatsuia symbiotica]MEA9444622.1 Fe-S cluster assembly scaffold SufA [Candidatus Fukatsuia symbiotica]